MLGKIVNVVIDRPLGSRHPAYPDCVYPLNYGYVPGVLAGDGEEQDAYIMGVDTPLSRFKGRVIALIRRLNDNEDKWVVAPEDFVFDAEEIRRATAFIERYFESEIVLWQER